jgi:outer membrane autotransporter protein
MHDRVARGRHAARLAAALLSTTGLTSSLGAAAAAILIAGWALPARADGGTGSGGAPGGGDASVGTGGAGGNDPAGGGGGGGAGQIGGQGGAGSNAGGLGGLAPGNPSANGQPGGNGVPGGAGGGGGGGAHGQVVVAPGTLVSATAGTGGLGGDGGVGGGGGGGAGGWGTSVISAGSFTNAGTVRGGGGGGGGGGFGGGNGGSGGLGLFFSGGSTSLVNSGTIAGGNGGAGGNSGPPGTPGPGGTGIVGGAGGFTIVNSGTISGGLSGAGVQANAITFSGGGVNSLTVQAGSTISGNVVAFFGGSDVLALGGSGNATFNVSQIGPTAQYENFANFQKTGSSTWTLTNTTTATTNWAINGGTLAISADNNLGAAGGIPSFNGGTLQFNASFTSARTFALNAGGGTFDTNGNAVTLSGDIGGVGGLTKIGAGTLTLSGTGDYLGGTNINGGTLALAVASALGSGQLTFDGGTLQTTASFTIARAVTLNAGGGAFNPNSGTTFTLGNPVGGSGALTMNGGGTLILSGANSYSGGTTVNAGTLQLASGASLASGSALAVNGGTFALNSNSMMVGALSGTGGAISLGSGTLTANSASSTTLASAISGTGGLSKLGTGTLNLTGANTYTGPTMVNGGTLSVNGSLASIVFVNNGGTLGGTGTVGPTVINNGIISPGNSIGTLNINGNFIQNNGIYQVEANAAGQSDRVNVGGRATINAGTVQVLAQPGSYANSTTYTILRANVSVAGFYSGVTSNFAFLTPTLSYDANDVFLTLAIAQNAFTPAFVALTPNQRAVGIALNQSFANASGDFAAVIGALVGLNTVQGPIALDTISGRPYADFGTMNVNNAAMFMNALGQQMANARGSSASAGQRQALAQACEIESCDAVGPLSAWASALGGLGSVLGDGNASTLTYNFGGAAAGIDYRLNPRFLVGIGTGYTHGTQWVNSFMGQGWSDSVSFAAYGSFTQSNFYLDALAGYAYFNNQLQRQILIPGLQQRTATGSTGANQFLGQAEGGYKVDVYAPAAATITPFGRLQISSVTQNAFSESGAQSLSLNVAQQTTNSLRTTIGADLGSSIGLGNERKLDLAVRLGWQHELADTGRPITAAFAGAPGNSFTVFGATPTRDAAVVGFQATTTIAAATQVYLRYDGDVGGGTDNHALNVGLRMSW